MPNRIIKESICTSSEIDALTPEEEVTFYRMIVNCDDYGRMEAETKQLRAKLFPNKIDEIPDATMEAWVQALTRPGQDGNGLIYLYQANGRRYLQMTKWEEHQRIRAKRSKHPDPVNGSRIDTTQKGKQESPATTEVEVKPTEKHGPDSLEMKLAESLKAAILHNNPEAKTPGSLQTWVGELERMMRIDGRSYNQIEAIIRFSQGDPFWQTNILSAKKLREKYDTLFLQSKKTTGTGEPRAWDNIKEWLAEEGVPGGN